MDFNAITEDDYTALLESIEKKRQHEFSDIEENSSLDFKSLSSFQLETIDMRSIDGGEIKSISVARYSRI